MTAEELMRVYEKAICAVQRHGYEQSMDDAECIRVLRVLIETAEESLTEIGQSGDEVERAAWKLTEFAKDLYVRACLDQSAKFANGEEFVEESAELFDYVFFHGTYPE
ncbi:MAG: hypothetical protein WBM40_16200 [Thiohalocapsa sp.]